MAVTRKIKRVSIPLVLYPYEILFSLGETDKELLKLLKKHGINDIDTDSCHLEEDEAAKCIMFNNNKVLIRLLEFPVKPAAFGILQHEIFHAVDFVLRKVGVKLTDDSCEAYSYLIGYVTEKLYSKILKEKPIELRQDI